ncbi:MAG: glycosyltransferase [Anaerolineae bacterium]
MKVLILTLGSRGDVQPYVAFAKGLIEAGHEPLLATDATFKEFITAHGVPYAYVNEVIGSLISGDAAREALAQAQGVIGWIKVANDLNAQIKPLQRQMLSEQWTAAQVFQPDVVVYHPKALGGRHIAEALGVPGVIAVAAPGIAPTRAFPAVGMPELPFGEGYNRSTYGLVARMANLSYGGLINEWRDTELKLEKRSRYASDMLDPNGQPTPILQAFSPHLLPNIDWEAHVHTVGFWFLETQQAFTPDADLVRFLEAGEAPVYVGFGSMTSRDPQKMTQTVVDALVKTGQRGLIATGWGGISEGDLPANVYRIREAPHSWLFPRVKAVVHHGGAGTTAAGLRAGRPTLICPFFGDQPLWGARVHELGAGPAPIPEKKLTVDNLSEALRALATNSTMQQNAAALGEKMRAEDGLANGIRWLEHNVPTRQPVRA